MNNINITEEKKHPFSILRAKETASVLGVSLPTLYRRAKDEDFPDKVVISRGHIGWKAGEIEEYINSKKVTEQRE